MKLPIYSERIVTFSVIYHPYRRNARVKYRCDPVKKAHKFDGGDCVRAAAAKGNAAHFPASAQQPSDQRYFPFERLQIGRQSLALASRPGVAAAIPANRMAIGNMDVERQRCPRRHVAQRPNIFLCTTAVVEFHSGRVARIARYRLCQQFWIIWPHDAGDRCASRVAL